MKHRSLCLSLELNHIGITAVKREEKTEMKPRGTEQKPCVASCSGRERIKLNSFRKVYAKGGGGVGGVQDFQGVDIEREMVSFCTLH